MPVNCRKECGEDNLNGNALNCYFSIFSDEFDCCKNEWQNINNDVNYSEFCCGAKLSDYNGCLYDIEYVDFNKCYFECEYGYSFSPSKCNEFIGDNINVDKRDKLIIPFIIIGVILFYLLLTILILILCKRQKNKIIKKSTIIENVSIYRICPPEPDC